MLEWWSRVSVTPPKLISLLQRKCFIPLTPQPLLFVKERHVILFIPFCLRLILWDIHDRSQQFVAALLPHAIQSEPRSWRRRGVRSGWWTACSGYGSHCRRCRYPWGTHWTKSILSDRKSDLLQRCGHFTRTERDRHVFLILRKIAMLQELKQLYKHIYVCVCVRYFHALNIGPCFLISTPNNSL